jgi:hypothetical protein
VGYESLTYVTRGLYVKLADIAVSRAFAAFKVVGFHDAAFGMGAVCVVCVFRNDRYKGNKDMYFKISI